MSSEGGNPGSIFDMSILGFGLVFSGETRTLEFSKTSRSYFCFYVNDGMSHTKHAALNPKPGSIFAFGKLKKTRRSTIWGEKPFEKQN